VGVVDWIGDLDHFSELTEVWIQLEGIPPKWYDWKVFAQMTSGFGLMLEMDWSYLFKSFYEKIRIRIACRNPRKLPQEWLYEMDKRLYLISILVEGYEDSLGSGGSRLEDRVDNGQDGDEEFDDDHADDLDDVPDNMDTEKPIDKQQFGTFVQKSSAPRNVKSPGILPEVGENGDRGAEPDTLVVDHILVKDGMEPDIKETAEGESGDDNEQCK
jgi:hypothetical protein